MGNAVINGTVDLEGGNTIRLKDVLSVGLVDLLMLVRYCHSQGGDSMKKPEGYTREMELLQALEIIGYACWLIKGEKTTISI